MEKPRKKYKILIVDDDVELLDMLKVNFKVKGFDVSTVQTGREAIDFCNKLLPDLIILDVKLPDMKGHGVIKWLKEQPRTQQIPVIFLTILDDEASKRLGFEMGAKYYIKKPCNLEQLNFMVNTIISTRQESFLIHSISSLPAQHFIDICAEKLKNRRNWSYLELGIDFLQDNDATISIETKYAILHYFSVILNEVIANYGTPDDFVGHAKDDNFIMILNGTNVFELVASVKRRFDKEVKGFFHLLQNEHMMDGQKVAGKTAVLLSIGIVQQESLKFRSVEDIRSAAREARLLNRFQQKSPHLGNVREFEKWLHGFFSWTLVGFQIKLPKSYKNSKTLEHRLLDKLMSILLQFLEQHGGKNDLLISVSNNKYVLITQNQDMVYKTKIVNNEFKEFVRNQWGPIYKYPELMTLPDLEVTYTTSYRPEVAQDFQKLRNYLFSTEQQTKKKNIYEILRIGKYQISDSPNWNKVRELIEKHFNLDELEILCFELGIEAQEIHGGPKSVRTKRLVEHCFRHGKAFELVVQCQLLRPNVFWFH